MASRKKPSRAGKRDPTPGELNTALARLKAENAKLRRELAKLSKESKAQQRKLARLERDAKLSASLDRAILAALEIGPTPKRGDKGAVGRLAQSLLSTDEHVLSMGKRIESMLSALKNHREYLIKLNKKVYKIDPVKRLEMELAIMGNTLSIMALSGYDIDKGLFKEMRRINKILEKGEEDLVKAQKRMVSFRARFKEEMERFDLEKAFKKADIPGYH
jgi:hypothetical protein